MNKPKIYIPRVGVTEKGEVVDKNKTVKTQFVINFEFQENESFQSILDKLDARLNDERTRAAEAIAKFKGVKIDWNEKS